MIREEMKMMKNFLNGKIEKELNNKNKSGDLMLEINTIKEENKIIQSEIINIGSEISYLKKSWMILNKDIIMMKILEK